MQRGFANAKALPQQTIGRGIVDLVLTGRRSRVLVEVKIGAQETQTKIYGHGWVPEDVPSLVEKIEAVSPA